MYHHDWNRLYENMTKILKGTNAIATAVAAALEKTRFVPTPLSLRTD